MKSREPGQIGLWSAATLVIDNRDMRVVGMDTGEPEFIEQASERLGMLLSHAAGELKGQPIDRGQS